MIHDHRIAWQEAQILKTESDYSKRLFAESWFINKESNILNRNDGVETSESKGEGCTGNAPADQ